jgi:hypothetical protein
MEMLSWKRKKMMFLLAGLLIFVSFSQAIVTSTNEIISLRRIKSSFEESKADYELLSHHYVEVRRDGVQHLYSLLSTDPQRFLEVCHEIKQIAQQEKDIGAIFADEIVNALLVSAKIEGEVNDTGDPELNVLAEKIKDSQNYEYFQNYPYFIYIGSRYPTVIRAGIDTVVMTGIPIGAVYLGLIGPDKYQGEIRIFKKMADWVKEAHPEFVGIMGGTGSELLRGMDMGEIMGWSTFIIEAPWDDGGSTRTRRDQIEDLLGRGWTPAVGDEARARAAHAAEDIQAFLTYRTPKKKDFADYIATLTDPSKTSYADKIIEAIKKLRLFGGNVDKIINKKLTADPANFYEDFVKLAVIDFHEAILSGEMDKKIEGKLILGGQFPLQRSPFWMFFLSNMLNAAREMDKIMGRGNNYNGSFKNDITLALRLEEGGSFDKEVDEEINWEKFRDESIILNMIFGINDAHVVVNSFDKRTLYAKLKDKNVSFRVGNTTDVFSIGKDKNGKLLLIVNGKVQWVERSFVPVGKSDIEVMAWIDGNDIKFRLKRGERVGKIISLNEVKDKSKINSLGQNFKIYNDGTLIIEQTNITEGYHLSPIKEFGFIENLDGTNTSLPKYVEEAVSPISSTNDNLKAVVVGPGSFYTSMIQGLLPIVKKLKELGKQPNHPPRIFVFNPYLDNETGGYKSILDMVKMLEETLSKSSGEKIKFQDLFDAVVINDINKCEDKKEIERIVEEQAEEAVRLATELRDPGDVSKAAKLARALLIPEASDIQNLEKRGIKVFLRPIAVVGLKEERKGGRPTFTEGVVYDPNLLRVVLEEIIREF